MKTNDKTVLWIDLASEKADDISLRVMEALKDSLTDSNIELLADQAWARTIANELWDQNSKTFKKVFGDDEDKSKEVVSLDDILSWLRMRVRNGWGRRYSLALDIILRRP